MQPELRIEFSPVVRATTGQAGDPALDATHPREIAPAMWAPVKKAPSRAALNKREGMTTCFVYYPEIAARPAPFRTVGGDPAPTTAVVGEQVREFVPKGAVDFQVAMVVQFRIEHDQAVAEIRTARTGAQAGIPFDLKPGRQTTRA
jgi:hypothetical protein